jgi:GMP synthase PP-ATPase subunit
MKISWPRRDLHQEINKVNRIVDDVTSKSLGTIERGHREAA